MKFFPKTTLFLVLMALLTNCGFAAEEKDPWEELNAKATAFYQEQKFMKAASYGREALEVARKLPDSEKEKLAISLGNQAMIVTHLGKFGEAEAYGKEELEVRQQLFGKEDLDVIKAWNHLAIIYTMAKNMKDAEFCLLQIVAIEEKVHGTDSLAIVSPLKQLEKFYKISGNAEKEKQTAERIAKLSPPTE